MNAQSGSNTEAAIRTLDEHCGDSGFHITRKIRFPDEDIPEGRALDTAGIDTLAVFTGDGTINAVITALYGWGGAVWVLPGGTMNLLSHRMHGDAELETIVERVSRGAVRKVRPQIARCAAGDALAGLLAGPGCAWNNVREAMREKDLPAIAQGTASAFSETTLGATVRCERPMLGKREGYPLIEMTPSGRGIQLDAYYADDAASFLQQSWALLQRDFRAGPHDRLGLVDTLTLVKEDAAPIDLLIDGEPATLPSSADFSIATVEVDLLATDHGY